MQEQTITTDEMKVLELNAEYLGITHSMLMQNAGREVARVMADNENIKGRLVVILCGLGGNGGDGMVAARYLDEMDAHVEVYLLGPVESISNPDTLLNWKLLDNLSQVKNLILKTESDVRKCRSIEDADILVDAMMGFGLHSNLREPILTAVKVYNKSTAKKYAIDVPTGIDSDTGSIYGASVIADHTIALHAPKAGSLVTKNESGKIHSVSIGIPSETRLICGPGDVRLLDPPRPKDVHKGDFGRILVIGGSDIFSGAPALTGMAALRAGADLVSILAPDPVVAPIRSYSPNLMVSSLRTHILTQESKDAVIEASKNQDAIAIGPGLGLVGETISSVRAILDSLSKRGTCMVIDADALKAIAGSNLKFVSKRTILTPHWGELGVLLDRKLSGTDDIRKRIDYALEAAKKYNGTILLKGPTDVVIAPDGRYKLNRTGVPAMSVGGTGDVLTGIASTLLSRKKGAFQAASASAYISGRAGELAFADKGNHIVATDCIAQIPYAMKY